MKTYQQQYITPEDYDIAEGNGIKKTILIGRVRLLGWSISRARTEPVQKKFKDTLSEEIIEILKENKINIETYRRRTTLYKWSKEKAMSTAILTAKEVSATGTIARRKISEKEYGIAKENKISITTLRARVYNYKWSIIKAITTPIKSNATAKSKGNK
jgi:DUF438 domain-containing protein